MSYSDSGYHPFACIDAPCHYLMQSRHRIVCTATHWELDTGNVAEPFLKSTGLIPDAGRINLLSAADVVAALLEQPCCIHACHNNPVTIADSKKESVIGNYMSL